jgi:hypothetical protein
MRKLERAAEVNHEGLSKNAWNLSQKHRSNDFSRYANG